jgi:hypothetical protein
MLQVKILIGAAYALVTQGIADHDVANIILYAEYKR